MPANLLKTVYCADVIAIHEATGKLVLIERLGSARGLALPGGKQDLGESLSETARRELLEETGLALGAAYAFGTYAEPERDPRGRYVSTVFVGLARGTPRDEPGKTRVRLASLDEAAAATFAFDHGQIVRDYLAAQK